MYRQVHQVCSPHHQPQGFHHIIDAFKFFVKIAIALNKVCPMVGVGFIPDISILTADFRFLLHGLIELLKRIFYLSSRLLDVGDSLNG